MVMARQRDRVDVNRTVGEHIGIGSNWKVCYRFGAGQNTRTRIGGGGGGVSGGGGGNCELPAVGSSVRAGGSSDGCGLGAVRWRSGAGHVVVGVGLSRSPAEDFDGRDRIALLTGIGYQSLFALLSFPYR